jgi:urate oxidase
MNDLAVLKSTGSAFENFVRDEYATLVEVDDRIFSTSVDLRYTYGEVAVRLPRDSARLNFGEENFDRNGASEVHAWEDAKVGSRAREITLDVFANDESASVQVRRLRGNEGVVVDNVIRDVDDVKADADDFCHEIGNAVQDGAASAR